MSTDHIKMLCDISELSSLFEQSSLEDLLQKAVDMVAEHMRAQVCSIYLYNDSDNDLVLRATHGLTQESVGKIRMSPGQGLVGLSFLEIRPIRDNHASKNPNFKFYPGINEELYDAFLAVPIFRGHIRIGVLVVQRTRGDDFSEKDELALRATASQLVSMLENIRLMIASGEIASASASGKAKKTDSRMEQKDLWQNRVFNGKKGAPGLVFANAVVQGVQIKDRLFQHYSLSEHFDLGDFDAAVKETKRQLEDLQTAVEERLSDAASLIFESHLLILKDPGFVVAMRSEVQEGKNAAEVILKFYHQYKKVFDASEVALIREKSQDLEDLTTRLLGNLTGLLIEEQSIGGHILIARDLLPSDLLRYSAQNIKGIILVRGGVTSHVAILARSLQIPLMLVNEPSLLSLTEELPVILDADHEKVYLNPIEKVKTSVLEKSRMRSVIAQKEDHGIVYTRDRKKISLMINVNLLTDSNIISSDEIAGVGLYRTEFPFIIRHNFPSEEEQFVIYHKLVQNLRGKPVTFRTLDIGGDKILSYYDFPHQDNPFLGMRSLRFSLSHQDIFKQQLRAILRAGAGCDLKLMFPMVSSLDDIYMCRELLSETQNELRNEGIEYNTSPDLGAMVEIPSTIAIIDELASELNFLSIGTNDLIQYMLAVDRTNEKVSDYYIPHHPAILRSLKRISEAGAKYDIPVSICGDMGSKERYIPFLLGIGINILSMDANSIRRSKDYIEKLDYEQGRLLAEDMLKAKSIHEVELLLDNFHAEDLSPQLNPLEESMN